MVDLLAPTDSPSRREHIEMDDNGVSRASSRQRLLSPPDSRRSRLVGAARHTVGLILLLAVVFLWTVSNFLGSSIFADNTYAKPFFLTYLNTSTFMLAVVPTIVRSITKERRGRRNLYSTVRSRLSGIFRRDGNPGYKPVSAGDGIDHEGPEAESFIKPTPGSPRLPGEHGGPLLGAAQDEEDEEESDADKYLGFIPTARLSLTFCFLWFGANYFAMACLQFTTVASTTILTSTSSFWTLIIGAMTGIEKFTWRKLCGVLGSFIGIIFISRVDLSADTNRDAARPSLMLWKRLDTFPEKPASELALGDGLALFSAIVYGLYTINLKKTTLKALPRSLDMALFFGLVGTFNLVLLFPLFPILHFTGVEPFALPPTRHIWMVLLVNSVSSFCSDICWAYAMVFTSPLLVTVGLSLTIPLSLVGEMVLQGHYEGWAYWVGAGIVVGSFLFIDQEERGEEEAGEGGNPAGLEGEGSRGQNESESESSYLPSPVTGQYSD